MSDHQLHEECLLCGGSGEVVITPFGQPDNAARSVGCPMCIQRDRDEAERERDQLQETLTAARNALLSEGMQRDQLSASLDKIVDMSLALERQRNQLLEFAKWVLSLKTGGLIEGQARAAITAAQAVPVADNLKSLVSYLRTWAKAAGKDGRQDDASACMVWANDLQYLLYTQQPAVAEPVARDVLIAAMSEAVAECAEICDVYSTYKGDRCASEIRHPIMNGKLAAIADRYAGAKKGGAQ